MTIKHKNPVTSVRLPEPTRHQLDQLAAKWNTSMAGVISIAIDRMYQQELNTMTTATTITISSGSYTVEQLAQLVASASQRGEWYDGPNSTHIEDWLAEGDYSSNETIESLAAEWDA